MIINGTDYSKDEVADVIKALGKSNINLQGVLAIYCGAIKEFSLMVNDERRTYPANDLYEMVRRHFGSKKGGGQGVTIKEQGQTIISIAGIEVPVNGVTVDRNYISNGKTNLPVGFKLTFDIDMDYFAEVVTAVVACGEAE